jgi:DNA helicase-2/ATP-dependent DNA helicase PcrA
VAPQSGESERLLQDLTEPQRQAVTHLDGPLLIIAAAGSGKTRVITRRVAYLMSIGVPPPSILAITFTNKAAGEMKQRISAASPTPIRDWGRLDQPWPLICTFHSLCLRILKHYAAAIGLPPNFSVFDTSDQTKLIKKAIEELDLSTTHFTPGKVHAAISKAKNQLIDQTAFAASNTDFFGRVTARVYTKYQALLKANNALDFDDLLLSTAHALRRQPAVLAELQERFRYILIDEYQDTNHAQYVLAHALALRHRNLCVVGDPDQSIYAWRGADLNNILDFEKDYPDTAVVRLEQNYRSTKTILAIADKLISHNARRHDKRLWTENAGGKRARVLLCQDEQDEARSVAAELIDLQRQGTPWSDMAVFYRMNALSRVIEDALRRAQVPYQIARGVEFYNRKEIKDVLAYLRVIANRNDEVSLARIVKVPARGISGGSVKLLQSYAVGAAFPLWEAMRQAAQVQGLSPRAVHAVGQFVQLIESFRTAAPIRSIVEEVVTRSGLEKMLRKEDPNIENELANVMELISSAAEYDKENPQGSLDDYLSRISLVSDADHLEGSGGSVTLMTLHAAKGLEFPVVAMVGLEEGCLPHSRAFEGATAPDELEEERRLCFVGITRAQAQLILSKAANRMIRGIRNRTATSQFLAQMPPEMLQIIDHTAIPGSGEDESLGSVALDSQSEFRRGQKVRHPAFGAGTIVDLSHSGPNRRAIVEFVHYGRKTLVLEHARLCPL